jgi:PEP-CTERM motif
VRLFLLVACLLSPVAAQAIPYLENPDAGESLTTSQLLPDGTTAISGFVGSADADLFEFMWGGGLFEANSFGTGFDTILSLFNASGYGVWLNDDTGGVQSSLSTALGAGTYYLGISGYAYAPVSSSGLIWLDGAVPNGQAPNGPGAGAPLSGWNNAAAATGNYTINFRAPTGAVPLPGSIALLGAGLSALVFSRRKQAN